MLVDHIGAYIFPVNIFRIIGRLAFPIFAYQLTVGYFKTSSKEKYLERLILFGSLSQIPYYLLKEELKLNIIFTLAIGFCLIWVIENKKFLLFFALIPLLFFVEYQLYGGIIILLFYFIKDVKYKSFSFAIMTFFYSFFLKSITPIFAIFSLIFIFGPKKEIDIPSNVFYIFYPAHLALIYLLRILIV